MRKRAIAGVVAFLIAVSLVVGYYADIGQNTTVTGASTLTGTTGETSTCTSTTSQTASMVSTTSNAELSTSSSPQIINVFGNPPFVSAKNPNPTTYELSPNTIIWQTFAFEKSTYISAAQAELFLFSSDYGDQVSIAVYVNGSLRSLENYTLYPPAPPPAAPLPSNQSVGVGVPLSANFSQGDVLSVALVSSEPLHLYVVGSQPTYEMASSSLPESLPETSANAAPQSVAIWGTAVCE